MSISEKEIESDIAEVFNRKDKYLTIAEDLLGKEGYVDIKVLNLDFYHKGITVTVRGDLGTKTHRRVIHVTLPNEFLGRDDLDFHLSDTIKDMTAPF